MEIIDKLISAAEKQSGVDNIYPAVGNDWELSCGTEEIGDSMYDKLSYKLDPAELTAHEVAVNRATGKTFLQECEEGLYE